MASRRGRLTIIMNNDSWAIKKKNRVFFPQEERKTILENIKGVYRVVIVPENNNNAIAVGEILKDIGCDIFQAGTGDSKDLIPICEKLGIAFIELKERGRDSTGHICSSTELINLWGVKH
jgi:glycerol-3-phosphate cytidylyltransferase-like family protein